VQLTAIQHVAWWRNWSKVPSSMVLILWFTAGLDFPHSILEVSHLTCLKTYTIHGYWWCSNYRLVLLQNLVKSKKDLLDKTIRPVQSLTKHMAGLCTWVSQLTWPSSFCYCAEVSQIAPRNPLVPQLSLYSNNLTLESAAF